MTRLNNASFNQAIWLLSAIYFIAISVQSAAALAVSFTFSSHLVINLCENVVALVFILLTISYYKFWPYIQWFSKSELRHFSVFLLPAAYIFLNMGDVYPRENDMLLLAAINTFISASFEELLCRAFALILLVRAFELKQSKRPYLYAILVSSLLFGLAHLANLISNPDTLGAVLGQVLYAFFIGVGFAACYIITRSLLPLIIIHGAINYMSFISESGLEPDAKTFEDTLGTVIVCLPLFLFGLWLLRKEPISSQINRKRASFTN